MKKSALALKLGFDLYRTDYTRLNLGYQGKLQSKNLSQESSGLNTQQLEVMRTEILTNPYYKQKIRDSWNRLVDDVVPAIYDQAYQDGFEHQFDTNSQELRTAGAQNGYGLGLQIGLDLAQDVVNQQLENNPNLDQIRVSLVNSLVDRDSTVGAAIGQQRLLEGDDIVPPLQPLAYQIDEQLEDDCKTLEIIPSEADPGYSALKDSLTDPTEPVPEVFQEAFADTIVALQQENQNVLNQNHLQNELQLVHSIGGRIDVSFSPVLSRISPLVANFSKSVDIGISASVQKQIDSDTFFKVNKGWSVGFSLTFAPQREVRLKVEDKQICEVGLKYQLNKNDNSTLCVDCVFNSFFGQSKNQSQENKSVSQEEIIQSDETSNVATACITCPDTAPPRIPSRQVFIAQNTPVYNTEFLKTSTTTWYFGAILLALSVVVGTYFRFFFKKLKKKNRKTT